MTDVKLLPLPEKDITERTTGMGRHDIYVIPVGHSDKQIQTYARANVEAATAELRAEVERWKLQSDDWQKRGWKLGGELDEAKARAERLEAALRNARDYVETALAEERIKFKGYEHCSSLQQMERDLASIDAALNAQPGETQ